MLRRSTALAVTLAAASLLTTARLGAQPVRGTLREHLDPTRLVAGSDSFVVIMRNAPRGWQRLSVARDGTNWLLGDALAIDGMMSQASTIRLDAALNESSLRQEGLMMGKPMRIALDTRQGRVTGTALTPSNPAGEIAIDVPQVEGLVDDNAVTPLLAIVRWRDSLAFSFPVLASGKGTVADFTLRTLGKESVTVPAGQFDTWRVELQMERARMIANVTTAAPYRVVRMSNGPAFEMQLVK
ncbi:MAG: hypothetical protein V4813_19470 [Gemmatimonadota bacterium]